MNESNAFHFPVSHPKISVPLLPFSTSLYGMIVSHEVCLECADFYLSDRKCDVLLIMFYREKLHHEYAEHVHTLFDEWDGAEENTEVEQPELHVGIGLSFMISLL